MGLIYKNDLLDYETAIASFDDCWSAIRKQNTPRTFTIFMNCGTASDKTKADQYYKAELISGISSRTIRSCYINYIQELEAEERR
jgi:hypothetical protein